MAKYITLENNYVHDTGANAITANMDGDDYEGFIIRNNEISNTGIFGEGLYLGCNNNNCQFHDGLIEGNYIHDLNGPLVDQGDGIEIKHGSYANVVRHNVIHDTRFPGILAYGTAGNGNKNLFEGNIVWGSENQTMQIASNAIIRNNLLFSSSGETIRSQNHQGATPGDLIIVNNTIISNNQAAIRVANSVTAPIFIANNAIYSSLSRAIQLPSIGGITLSGNVGEGSVFPALSQAQFDASGDLLLDFENLDWTGPGLDAFPTALSKLLGAAHAVFLPDVDFNGSQRSGSLDVGAFRFDSQGNPGWKVFEGFKQFPADFNRDFVVNELDLAIFQAAFGLGTEGDGDGDTDGADFLTWQRRIQQVAALASVSASVPEPNSFVLILFAAATLVCVGSRNRYRSNQSLPSLISRSNPGAPGSVGAA